jgi:hypothetical protein
VNSYTSLEKQDQKSSLMKTLYADYTVDRGEAHIVDFDLQPKENDIPFFEEK